MAEDCSPPIVCRTCLAADAEFYKLDAPIQAPEEDDGSEEKISFMECLCICTHLEDVPKFPKYICIDCSSALQVAYNFVRNALEAHEVLRKKLLGPQRKNGRVRALTASEASEDEEKCSVAVAASNDASGSEKRMRLRCKICNEKVETKRSLKEHVKLHLDIISYCCQLCNFECKKRSHLSEHYSSTHSVQPTHEQLRPKTAIPAKSGKSGKTTIKTEIVIEAKTMPELDDNHLAQDEVYTEMERLHNASEEEEQDIAEEERLLQEEVQQNLQEKKAHEQQRLYEQQRQRLREVHLQHERKQCEQLLKNQSEEEQLKMEQQQQLEMEREQQLEICRERQLIMDEQQQLEMEEQQQLKMEEQQQLEMEEQQQLKIEEQIRLEEQQQQEFNKQQQLEFKKVVQQLELQTRQQQLNDFALQQQQHNDFALQQQQQQHNDFALQQQQQQHNDFALQQQQQQHNDFALQQQGHDFALQQQQQQRNDYALQQHQQIDMSTIITPSSMNHINVMPQQEMPDFHQEYNDLNVGNEFIVMEDGTVEQVITNDVVIEFIQTSEDGTNSNIPNGMALNDVIQVDPSAAASVMPDLPDDMIDMDFDDIIIEEKEMLPTSDEFASIEDQLPQSIITVETLIKKIKCKICSENFSSQEKLKMHMLTHNEIPHFFCDQCKFYTFFKIDLTQHYQTKHKLQPTFKQLQPKNKVKPPPESRHIFSCDLCLFETNMRANLRRHYLSKHQVEATDVQLRPTLDDTTINAPPPVRTGIKRKPLKPLKPDYPNGLSCKKCPKKFYWRTKLKEHYRQHNMEEHAVVALNVPTAQQQINASNDVGIMQQQPSNNVIVQYVNAAAPATLLDANNETLIAAATAVEAYEVPNTYEIDCEVMPHIAALPSDAIPQIVETDTAIDNAIDFDFNDALFEDFEDDDEEDDDDDEHAKQDNDEFENLLLTSDDDFEDMLEEQQQEQLDSYNGGVQYGQPYCMNCNKRFLSQYQFENHMFVHRGLAPYRCEMCTNLYNTKRALIRHYKAVHKKMPTRDMIQAKGDKVAADRTPIEHLNLEEQKAITLMCAKCPYESTDPQHIQIHLNTSHGITDGSFILQKLPFECPRCIRSYASKTQLIRHLERSHSVATIIQQRQSLTPPLATTVQAHFQPQMFQTQQPPTQEFHLKSSTSAASSNARCGIQKLTTLAAEVTATSTVTKVISDQMLNSTSLDLLAAAQKQTSSNVTSTKTSTANAMLPSVSINVTTEASTSHEPTYKCQACDFTCSSIDALNDHSKDHPSDDTRDNFNFTCSICHCKYKTMEALKHHIKRHVARKYQCSKCPKTYINRGELNKHLFIHSGEMPHACDMCNKKFRYAHHLKRHRDVTHYGKRYLCPLEDCMRTFTTQTQLKIHAWSHGGRVPYKCTYCGRDFKKRASLRQHALKVHQINLTEAEIAEIFRNNVGHTNPHDFTVSDSNGQMLRRSEVEAAEEQQQIAVDFNSAHI